MKTVSNLIGKPILSVYEGRIEGYIRNILFDKKMNKICILQFFDDITQEEKIIEFKNIYHIGQDAIITKNSNCVLLDTISDDNFVSPINKDVYNTSGEKVGKVIDVFLNEKNEVENLCLQNQNTLSVSEILNVGKNVILQKCKNVTLSQFKSKAKIIKESGEKIKVEIQQTPITAPKTPKKLVSGSIDFLIGRKLTKNIYADNGELLAKKQTKINNVILDLICKNGKLKELTINSL